LLPISLHVVDRECYALYNRWIVALYAAFIVSCDSGSKSIPTPENGISSSNSTTSVESIDNVTHPPTPASSESSISPPEPVESIKISSTCPQPNATVPANTGFRFAVVDENNLLLNNRDDIKVNLTCDAATVTGLLDWDRAELQFKPNENLKPASTCSLIVDSLSDPTVAELNREFTVSDERLDMTFSDPVILDQQWSHVTPRKLLVDGDTLVLFYSQSSGLHIVISHDAGETFQAAEFDIRTLGLPSDISAEFHDGELYFTWKFLQVNGTSEIFFAKTINNMSEISSPIFISDPALGLNSRNAILAVEDADNIHIAWHQECPSRGNHCGLEDTATHFMTIDRENNVRHYEKLGNHTVEYTKLLFKNDSLYIAWLEKIFLPAFAKQYTVKVFNYTDGMREVISQPIPAGTHMATLDSLISLSADHTQVIWTEWGLELDNDHYSMSFDKNENIVEERFRLWEDKVDTRSYTTTPVTDGLGTLAWLESEDDEVVNDFEYFQRSSATGTDARYLINIPEILGDDLEGVSDSSVMFAFTEDKTTYLTWMRDDDRGELLWESNNDTQYDQFKALFSKGRFASPCERVKSSD